MVTGDLNAALVEWVVQYRISDPVNFLFGSMSSPGLDRRRGLTPRRRRIVQAQFTLGDIVEAVMHFAADSREAAVVVEDLIATGRIRFEFLKGMSSDGDLGSARRSGITR